MPVATRGSLLDKETKKKYFFWKTMQISVVLVKEPNFHGEI